MRIFVRIHFGQEDSKGWVFVVKHEERHQDTLSKMPQIPIARRHLPCMFNKNK